MQIGKNLKGELHAIDWSELKNGTAEHAVSYFLDVLWTLLIKYIPRKDIECTKSSHPWLNSRCRDALTKKNNAEGTDGYDAISKSCGDVLRDERQKYVERLKAKMTALPRGSKQWWRINR